MSKVIAIDPITRISGFLEIRADLEENTIVNATVSGLLYRGFEKILVNRPPLDAIYITERICGICSTAHAVSSTLALEDALKITVSQNDQYLRDIMHGLEFIQNHLRHFYILVLPSYVKITSLQLVEDQQFSDFRLPVDLNQKIENDYIKSIEMSRLAHEALAVLGGKAPHCHGIYVGGVTIDIDSFKIERVRSILRTIHAFVSTEMMEDAEIIATYYQDYFEKGISYPNFMSYGVFDKYQEKEISYVKAGIWSNGVLYPFDTGKITEQIQYAWYQADQDENASLQNTDAYTFIKASRYEGLPMEVGPLARMIISGEYNRGSSCMDRILARVMETNKILDILEKLIARVELVPNNQSIYSIPQSARGAGLVDTTRGALGHWIEIEKAVIHHYNIITPSVWNLSPRDQDNIPGVVERALIGTKLNNSEEPVEIGRIVRSFDPCVSCATHLISNGCEKSVTEVLI